MTLQTLKSEKKGWDGISDISVSTWNFLPTVSELQYQCFMNTIFITLQCTKLSQKCDKNHSHDIKCPNLDTFHEHVVDLLQEMGYSALLLVATKYFWNRGFSRFSYSRISGAKKWLCPTPTEKHCQGNSFCHSFYTPWSCFRRLPTQHALQFFIHFTASTAFTFSRLWLTYNIIIFFIHIK